MTSMLPTESASARSLAGLVPEFLGVLRGAHGRLGLTPVRSVVLVVVDGLGSANLGERSGHARFLSARTGRSLLSPVPSTTAASLPTILTGAQPGTHGLVGYSVLDPDHDRVVNQLKGWDEGMTPATWQRSATIFENVTDAAGRAVAVGPDAYAGSGFTRAVLRGAEYQSAASIADRVEVALRIAGEKRPAFVYVYIPELDKLAHSHGWRSDRWLAALEEVDAQLGVLHERLPHDVGGLLTADHGVIDVPPERHVLFHAGSPLMDGVRHVAGEPRFLQLHTRDAAATASVAAAWRDAEGDRAWVATREEAIGAGWFGDVSERVAPRIGDVLVAARAPVAYYQDAPATLTARRMIGQHGSLTDEERRVPFVRLGAWG
ncbi:Type I phosphodiesterase / nucleotide pyrophosphatase [Paramicrobacterium humi]|uniref:Type I phosphodiesterase / nucleotide pyrophosphatase n=1 Tax=Paramicrobacterium humi TaxID=640635 RepID=A0A1H4QL03_9MICO|nr:alkaline phosphatase family protein [Microbacterium humi]SEC20254.1 Type I phosphodiesterase / nucleotide pyrophosphatase [Microbacterium humi]